MVYGVADYSGGRATRTAGSFAVALLGQAAGLVVVLVALPLFGDPSPPWRDWVWGALGGLGGVAGIVGFYHAMAHGAMTVVAPLAAVVCAGLPVIVGLVQGERPGAVTLIGMSVALVGVALISGLSGRPAIPTSRAMMALAAFGGGGFALSFICLGEVQAPGLWPLLAFRLVSIVAVATVGAVAGTSLVVNRAARPITMVGGGLDMTANMLYLLAVRQGMLSVVSALAALYPVSTVVLAFRLDGERVSKAQGWGMLAVATALALVAVGRV